MKPRTFFALLLAAHSLAWAQDPASGAASPGPKIEEALKGVYPALVRVEVVVANGREGRMRKSTGSGSGAIISAEGHVLTNHHVAGDATRLVCRLANREEVEATLVGTDALSDLAILRLDLTKRRDPTPLPVAKFGNSDLVRVGDVVFAMGSPAGLSQSVTQGIVANVELISPSSMGGFVLDGENVGELVRWIGHDAVIYPGNSGGPLVNEKGEIIGVNEVGIGSLGGAIPSNLAQSVSQELIQKGYVSRSWLGLGVQPLLKSSADSKGVLAANIAPDSPAQEAGLQPGDIITSYNGQEVAARFAEELPAFNRLILTTPIGQEVELKGTRHGQAMVWKAKTAEREPAQKREVELKNWGMTARDLTRTNVIQLRRKSKDGVYVDSIAEGGACAEAKPKVVAGDVIVTLDGQPVRNLQELRDYTAKVLAGKTEPQPILVGYERDTEHFLTQVKVGAESPEDKPKTSRKAWLGVATQVLTTDLARALKLPGKKGVRITEVYPDTEASKAGLKVGDLVLKLDGTVVLAKNIEDQDVFENMIREYPVDSEAKLFIYRDGQEQEVSVKLEARPVPEEQLAEYEDKDFEFTARDLSFHDRVEVRNLQIEGVTFTKVQPAGWAALAGVEIGDILLRVGDQEVKSVAELEKTIKLLKEKKVRSVVFFTKRGAHTAFRELQPVWE